VTARDRLVVAIVCTLAALAGAWLLIIQPKRSQASSLGKQVSAAQAQLQSVQAQVAQGTAARASFARSYTQLARLGEAVPSDDNVPSLIYQLQGAANATGVDFHSLVLQPASSTSAPATTTTPSTSGSSTTPAGSTTSAGSTTPAGSTPTPGSVASATALAGPLPPGATTGPAGFPEEQFAFTFNGNFFHLAKFFRRLENFVLTNNKDVAVSGRLMTLNAISFGAGPAGFPSISASISATDYLVPAAQGIFNGATPTGPSSSSTPVTGAASATFPTPTAAVTP
jgi:type II secretory pathway pseudopilin PulG